MEASDIGDLLGEFREAAIWELGSESVRTVTRESEPE